MNAKKAIPGDGYFSKKEASEYLRLSPRTLDALIARGELIAFKVTRKLLFRKRDLDLLVERHKIRSLNDLVNEVVQEVLDD
jgi:excisionase family DNA binding protein